MPAAARSSDPTGPPFRPPVPPPLARQYLLTFMTMGCVLPYVSVWFSQRGFGHATIGLLMSFGGWAVLVGPAVLTLLADTRLASRRLIGGCFAAAAAGLALAAAGGVWAGGGGRGGGWTLPAVAVGWAAYTLAMSPQTSLQDGLFFAEAARIRAAGGRVTAYHRIRVWGTWGFLLPAMVLYGLIVWRGGSATPGLVAGAVVAGLGAANAWRLPAPRHAGPADAALRRGQSSGSSEHPQTVRAGPAAGLDPQAGRKQARSSRLDTASADAGVPVKSGSPPGGGGPTLAAARAVWHNPRLRAYVAGMWLLGAASGPYYAFYPLYLTESVGLGVQWVGLVSNVGVAVEVGFVLGFGWLRRTLGLRLLLTLAAALTAARFGLLATSSHLAVAVGTQLLHGVMVLLLFVAPPTVLDRHADGGFRSSIQGLFAMVVSGTGRVTGTLVAGLLAERSLGSVFAFCAGLSAVAVLLLGRGLAADRTDRRSE